MSFFVLSVQFHSIRCESEEYQSILNLTCWTLLVIRTFVFLSFRVSTISGMADEVGERFEIERIVDKRYRNDRVEYLIKWRGYPDSQNTWEPCKWSRSSTISFILFSSVLLASHIEGEQESELLAEYESFNKQQQQKALNSNTRPSINPPLSPNKRRTVRRRPAWRHYHQRVSLYSRTKQLVLGSKSALLLRVEDNHRPLPVALIEASKQRRFSAPRILPVNWCYWSNGVIRMKLIWFQRA